MTSRERTLATLVGAFILVLLVGVGGYVGVYLPLSSKREAARALDDDIADKEAKLAGILKDKPRLDAALKRSLPAHPDDARQEYDAAISRLLRDANVPAAAITVRPKAVDNRNVPEIAPKLGNTPARPAYTKVALEVTLKPVSYATLIDVLYRYYRLDLLQQITKFNVKRLEGGAAARRTGSVLQDRADLEVQFVTEAVILDGAENRRTLAPVPTAMGAAGGAAGYGALLHSPVVARRIVRPEATTVLAAADRDYTLMLVKDVFHGPPDPPQQAELPKPKEDTSRFIRLTGVGRNPDGTGRAFIEDTASKQQYEIELTRKGGDLISEVVKYYFINRIKKAYAPETILDISESSSGTARKFRVIGLDGDALILAELGGSASAAAPGPAARRGSRSGRPPRPPTPPAAVVLGGFAAVVAPTEAVFVWRHGEPLNQVKALSREEAQKAVQRATAGQPDAIPATGRTVPVDRAAAGPPTAARRRRYADRHLARGAVGRSVGAKRKRGRTQTLAHASGSDDPAIAHRVLRTCRPTCGVRMVGGDGSRRVVPGNPGRRRVD